MIKANHSLRRIVVGSAAVALIWSGLAWATAGSGTSSTLVGPPAVFEGFKVKREAISGWELEIEAKQGLTVATQQITFQPGGQSGWHSHPGPVFIAVKEGTMTFYEDDCSSRVVMAGQGFLDTGSHAHIARNETGSPAVNVVTYFAPPGTTVLRIDAPQPPDCRL